MTTTNGTIASIIATADVLAKRFIRSNGVHAAANQRAIGVSGDEASTGDPIPVVLDGTALVETGGAVAENDLVASDANGRAISAGTNPANGIAMKSASGAGQFIEIKVL